MNHTTSLAIVLEMLAVVAALIAAVGISIQTAAALMSKDPTNRNQLIMKIAKRNSNSKSKRRNNISGFATGTNQLLRH
jgi:conjugal transfer/entry exclusion protein